MKKDIHPKYYPNAKVTCSCGNSFEVGSTMETIDAEVCSACHPFYTGTAKFIDTAGRVDKFQAKMKKAEEYKAKKDSKKKK
jgi:large subunit ribosomal protein L31